MTVSEFVRQTEVLSGEDYKMMIFDETQNDYGEVESLGIGTINGNHVVYLSTNSQERSVDL